LSFLNKAGPSHPDVMLEVLPSRSFPLFSSCVFSVSLDGGVLLGPKTTLFLIRHISCHLTRVVVHPRPFLRPLPLYDACWARPFFAFVKYLLRDQGYPFFIESLYHDPFFLTPDDVPAGFSLTTGFPLALPSSSLANVVEPFTFPMRELVPCSSSLFLHVSVYVENAFFFQASYKRYFRSFPMTHVE